MGTATVCFAVNEIGKRFNIGRDNFKSLEDFAICLICGLSAGGAVYGWDKAQIAFANFFHEPSSDLAQYVSSIGAGLAEGPFQAIVTLLLMVGLGKFSQTVAQQSPFQSNDPRENLKVF